MKLCDVQRIGKKLVLAKPTDVNAIESELWLTLPNGYRDYVTSLGEGVLGSFVRIYPPWRVSTGLTEWRRRIAKYWFWEKSRKILPKERALESVVIGDTVNGDELVFHPSRSNCVFVLPRDSERAIVAGENLLAALEWICTSGKLVEPFADLTFEAFDSRILPRSGEKSASKVTDPEGESLDDIIQTCKRWVKRHSVRSESQRRVKEYSAKGKKMELLFESIVLTGEFPHYEPGYTVAYRIVDEARGVELGTCRWHKGDEFSSDIAFEPSKGRRSRPPTPKR